MMMTVFHDVTITTGVLVLVIFFLNHLFYKKYCFLTPFPIGGSLVILSYFSHKRLTFLLKFEEKN